MQSRKAGEDRRQVNHLMRGDAYFVPKIREMAASFQFGPLHLHQRTLQNSFAKELTIARIKKRK